jgi:hypothetical protein
MTMNVRYAAVFAVALTACDDKPQISAGSSDANTTVSVPPLASSAPPVVSATASAASSTAPAPSSSSTIITGAGSDDETLTVKDPKAEPEKSISAKSGGAFTLFLPDVSGTTWSADSIGTLGKAKEEMMPGFAPKTMAHQFKWTGLKAGKTKLTFGLRNTGTKGGTPTQTFTLNLDVN